MDRNTVIAFVLIGAILILWFYLNAPEPPKPTEKTASDSTLVRDTTTNKVPEKKPEPIAETPQDSLKYGMYFGESTEEEEIILLENDVAVIELSTKGANIRKCFLKDYKNWYSIDVDKIENYYRNAVQLINYTKGNSFNLLFVTADGKAVNTKDLVFNTDGIKNKYVLSGTDSIMLSFTLPSRNGGKIVKNYTLFGNKYGLKSTIQFEGMQNVISSNAFDILWENGINYVEENSVDEASYSNAGVYYGDELVSVDASGDEKVTEDFRGRIEWLGVKNKYFAAAIIPENPSAIEGAFVEGRRKNFQNNGVREYYDLRLNIPLKNTTSESFTFDIYMGPNDYDILEHYNEKLTTFIDFGSFFGLKFIVRPIAEFILLPLFNFLHMFIPNYGFVIIVFSLIIKIVLYPLTKSSFQSMKKMQLLQPKIAEMKEKFKDDPQKMNSEMMKIYKVYGVNPAGGCFPLILQMPIFIAMWGLFQTAIDLRQQPFILWIKDLSRPDVIYQLGFNLPLFNIDLISGLALLMGITTFVQQKMSVKDPKQQAMIYIMPVMLTLMFMSFPSGLNLYYFMFNVFSIAQQYYINHTHSDMVLEPVKNPKKTGGFISRLMEAAEKNAKNAQRRK